VDETSKDDYFESLFYSSAVVGLNTSAFLEGAIVGRPVHTILLPEFHENQEGVLHFHYLMSVSGGVLRAGRSFDEHHLQLAESLRRSSTEPSPVHPFVREFIRPHGLERPATPVFSDAIEDVLRMPAPAPEQTPWALLLLRWVMSPAFRSLRAIYGSDIFRDDWSRKEQAQQMRREARAQARLERQRAGQAEKQERNRRRVEKLAAREAAARTAATARTRAEAEKAQRKRAKERDKAAHVRRRARAAMRTRIKQGASRWLDRWRPGRQTT